MYKDTLHVVYLLAVLLFWFSSVQHAIVTNYAALSTMMCYELVKLLGTLNWDRKPGK